MQGLLAYVRSRVAAMRGDIHRAIALCLAAREYVPASNVALQLDTRITLGYEYFLAGDYANASPILKETIRSGMAAGAVINTVAASSLMARLVAVQGLLNQSYAIYRTAAQSIPQPGGQHLGARALVEVGLADLYCERNDLDAALAHVKQGLAWLPFWGKADDWALAYITLARIHLAQANRSDAIEAVEEAIHAIQSGGVFSEARNVVEITHIRLWLAQGDRKAASRWAASQEERLRSDNSFGFENELHHITLARVLIAQNEYLEAIGLLSHLQQAAESAGRMGRVIEILLLEALAMREIGDSQHAMLALTRCLTLAEPESYRRIFLDEGRPIQMLLAQWLPHAGSGSLRDYAIHLLSQFDAATACGRGNGGQVTPAGDRSTGSGQALVEPLSPRELEVLHLMALGSTNQEIAQQLVVSTGTVKAHTASIYRKLDVANRTEAMAPARQRGILP